MEAKTKQTYKLYTSYKYNKQAASRWTRRRWENKTSTFIPEKSMLELLHHKIKNNNFFFFFSL